jgi:hypothetical protein
MQNRVPRQRSTPSCEPTHHCGHRAPRDHPGEERDDDHGQGRSVRDRAPRNHAPIISFARTSEQSQSRPLPPAQRDLCSRCASGLTREHRRVRPAVAQFSGLRRGGPDWRRSHRPRLPPHRASPRTRLAHQRPFRVPAVVAGSALGNQRAAGVVPSAPHDDLGVGRRPPVERLNARRGRILGRTAGLMRQPRPDAVVCDHVRQTLAADDVRGSHPCGTGARFRCGPGVRCRRRVEPDYLPFVRHTAISDHVAHARCERRDVAGFIAIAVPSASRHLLPVARARDLGPARRQAKGPFGAPRRAGLRARGGPRGRCASGHSD